MRLSIVLIYIFLIGLIPLMSGQANNNPFDLPSDKKESGSTGQEESANPFELTPNQESKIPAAEERAKTTATSGFEIGISVSLIIALALLLTFFRGVFNDFVESAYRDRKFNQFFRRMKSMWILPNILFYIFFCISLGVFVYLGLNYLNAETTQKPLQLIGIITASIFAFFVAKHLILSFIGSTFELVKETSRYSLLIMTFNIIVGIVLMPFVILLLLGPEHFQGTIIVLGILTTAILLGLFLLRALSVSNRFLVQHSFHFFMYLCAIEIAPLFIIAKVLS